MKASRFSDAQKAFILKQGADGMPEGRKLIFVFAGLPDVT
jgi:hypothetical protein